MTHSLKLNRRAFLRGLGGVSLALPVLDAMGAEITDTPPRRFCAIYTANGMSLPRAENQIDEWSSEGWQVGMVFSNKGEEERFLELAGHESVAHVVRLRGELVQGFTVPVARMAVLSSSELFGRYRTPGTLKRSRHEARRILTARASLDDIAEGDLVVHHEYGIGRFRGIAPGESGEEISIEYKDGGLLAVLFFDRVKVDDPVGAVSVHLVNGVWGTLALGLFYDNDVATNIAALATGLSRFEQTLVQLKGILAVGGFTVTLSLAFWYAIKLTMGLRVSEEEEVEGLDLGEHGNSAYPDFATHASSFGGVPGAAAPVYQPVAAGKPATVKL